MRTLVLHSAFFALIGLILSPLAVAHASPPLSEFDYEQWERDHPHPATKRLADRNVGEPRTVRMIYFLPNDRPFRQKVVDSMKAVIRYTQTFFAEQMQAHGYVNKTFRFETDDYGEPVVHRVDGQFPDSMFDENILFMVLDQSGNWGGGVRKSDWEKSWQCGLFSPFDT